MDNIQYRGFTIEEDSRNPYSKEPEYMVYPTEAGVQHDADCDQDGFFYTGNCLWFSSVQEAKDEIDEIIDLDETQIP
jgi:hypothetical protein